jgi:replication-associated recombination protein RarA
MAPKSNAAYRAIRAAQAAIEGGANVEVPLHLRNASFAGARGLGYGREYRYPHDYPDGWVEQRYLPDGVEARFYEPSDRGHERRHREKLDWQRGASDGGSAQADPIGAAGGGPSSGAARAADEPGEGRPPPDGRDA